MIDVSDGLSSDLARLCKASGVGASVEAWKIPVVQAPKGSREGGNDPLNLALHGGDDYELLFTVSPRKAKLLPKSFQELPLASIGRIIHEKVLLLIEEDGRRRKLLPQGWDPFRETS